jgi:hypothetical protein
MEYEYDEPPRIGNRSDALELLEGMIGRIKESNAAAAPPFRGRENAIGNEAYYRPRLEALRDAIERVHNPATFEQEIRNI